MVKMMQEVIGCVLLAAVLVGCVSVPEERAGPKAAASVVTPEVKPVPEPKEEAKAPVPTVQAVSEKAILHSGTGVFVKKPEGSQSRQVVASRKSEMAANKPKGGGASDEVTLMFEAADVREVIKAIMVDILKESYSIDPKVQGTVSINTSRPIRRSDVLPTLETLLRMNGAAIVKDGGIYKIMPAGFATQGTVTPILNSSGRAPNGVGYTVQIVPLRFIAAKEMRKILEPYSVDASTVRVDEARNLLILSGTEREQRHLLETIEMFDVDWLSGMSVGLFVLQNVDVKTAAFELEKIFGEKVSGVLKLLPMERMNAILAISTQDKYLAMTKLWIERIDQSGNSSGGTRLYVYPMQNGNAVKMAELLNEVFGKKSASSTPPASLAPGQAPAEIRSTAPSGAAPAAPPAAPSSSPPKTGEGISVASDVRVIADKDNNALLILASPADYEKIEATIRKLDIVPRQVLIDVTIAEVSLTGDLKFGLEWYINSGKRLSGQLSTLKPGTDAAKQLGLTLLRNTGAPGGIAAVLNMLSTDSRVKVISSPHIMVTDNQTAKIDVGNKVPTTSQTQSVPGAAVGIISSIQYVDTGVILSVTPHINAGGMVTMEVNQEVSAALVTDTSNIDSPTIRRRAIKSTVVVQTGETVVLGGLITENKTKATSGIPLLSQIPVLGGLFGTQDWAEDRTELVVLITPRVVNNPQQAREITDEFRRKIGSLGELLGKTGKSGIPPAESSKDKPPETGKAGQ